MARDVVTRTERLVAVDTAPGCSTGPAVDLLREELRALGADVAVQSAELDGLAQHNLVARFGGAGPAGLLLAGHVDTVPWQQDFRATTQPERDGRRLFGRGACDMKGPLSAQIEAAAACCETLKRPLVLAFTYAEEIGCHGALQLTADNRALGDLTGGVCIVGEPTGLRPIVGHKGYAVAWIDLGGAPAHSSNPWDGADTSVALGRLLVELHALREQLRVEAPAGSRHDPPCTTLNTGLVTSGLGTNMVPDRSRVSLEWRPVPGTDHEALRRAVQACLERACAGCDGVEGRLDWPRALPAFDQSDSDAFVTWATARTGLTGGLVSFYTEAELYRDGLSLPTIVCGPGAIEQAHTVDESIGFDELEQGVAFYADAIEHCCG